MKSFVYVLNAILIAFAICAAPLFYVGSFLLLGLGHGSSLFYVMYGRVGYVLPSIAAILACYRNRYVLSAAALMAILCTAVYAYTLMTLDYDTYTLRKLFRMWPVLTAAVASGGVVISIFVVITCVVKYFALSLNEIKHGIKV